MRNRIRLYMDQLAILVGSCLIDGKENLITGSLYKDPKTGEVHFGGGWTERAHIINKPLYWGMGGNGTSIVISGLAIDKTITEVRVSSMDGEQSFTVPVSDKGYFAAWVPIERHPDAPRGSRVWVEGLDKTGDVVYSFRKPQTSKINLQERGCHDQTSSFCCSNIRLHNLVLGEALGGFRAPVTLVA